MRALLDTCVVYEISRPRGSTPVKDHVASLAPGTLYLSVITIGEIAKGIERLTDEPRRRQLTEFLDGLTAHYGDRILPIDAETAELWGRLTARAQRRGRVLGACDGLIAATAIRHGLHVLTRNVTDFAETGALVVNPWGAESGKE